MAADASGKKKRGRGTAERTAAPRSPAEKTTAAQDEVLAPGLERLHKYLASTGAGSRRECETFIAQGRVTVNGQVVTRMGQRVDPAGDVVTLDGERVRPEERVYYLLHKPPGYICTNADERGRQRVVDLIRDERRVYTVGRLDADSTGIVLVTNDGGIANIVCHPRYRIEKRYRVHVRGEVTRAQIARVEAGVWLAEGRSSPATVRPVGRNPKRGEMILEMTLFEGRNREIRRVCAKVGLTVRRLQRTSIGPLGLGDLPPGAYRKLEPRELAFVDEAEKMYLANKAAWDAELPPEDRRRPAGRRQRDDARGRPRARSRAGHGEGGRPAKGGWGAGTFPKRGRRRSETESDRGARRDPRESSTPPRGRRRRYPA